MPLRLEFLLSYCIVLISVCSWPLQGVLGPSLSFFMRLSQLSFFPLPQAFLVLGALITFIVHQPLFLRVDGAALHLPSKEPNACAGASPDTQFAQTASTHTHAHTRGFTHTWLLYRHTHTRLLHTHTHTHTHTQCLVASSLERESFPFVWVCLHISVHTRCN